MGLDLQVLSERLTASHANIRNPMEAIIRGYISIDGDNPDSENANKVITRFEEIKSRFVIMVEKEISILFATSNQNKINEAKSILGPIGYKIEQLLISVSRRDLLNQSSRN